MSRPWWHDDYWKRRGRSPREYKTPKSRFSRRKSFLIFLLIACLVTLIYTGYLLFTHRTDPIIGTIILVADIGVLIWNISVLRKWKVGARTIVAIAVVIAVLGATTGAFADIKPFSTAKSEVVTWFQKAPSQPSEQLPPPAELPFPTASEYPADISGHVIIAEKVIAKYDRNKPDTTELTPLEGQIYWIVDISVKNKAYENAVTASYKDWKIVADDKVCDSQKPFMDIWPSTAMSVLVGDTGETTIRFPVPDTLEVSSAKLCYQGQEPYSYGNLSGGDRVAAYDWDNKTIIEEPEVAGRGYLKVADIWGVDFTAWVTIMVQLESTSQTKPGHYYVRLLSGKEDFGEKTINWSENKQLATLGWDISITDRAWAELQRGEPCKDVFQVEISYEPY